MKANKILMVPALLLLLLTGCGNSSEGKFQDKNVNVYRSVGDDGKPVVDKQIALRFYDETPNVPYISVGEYFKEFFKTNLVLQKDGDFYKYYKISGEYISFDSKHDLFTSLGLYSFNIHPNFKSTTGKYFLNYDGVDNTTPKEKTVSLKSYSIDIRDNGKEAYVPLTFLSKLAGGYASYNVEYNMKDIYVIDRSGELGKAVAIEDYSTYYEVWDDENFTSRPADLVNYTYGELCFVFDNLRGYTSQLAFGDNNLLTLGLNGLIELYYPSLKTLLLSQNKVEYYKGITALFFGLSDGGHTGMISSPKAATDSSISKALSDNPELVPLVMSYGQMLMNKLFTQSSCKSAKTKVFSLDPAVIKENPNYYVKDDATKTAFIGFDSFKVDYTGWDNFYNNKGSQPGNTDTYSFILNSLNQAKQDGVENVVIDITSNGGGDSAALCGIVGLLNGSKANFDMNDTFNQYRITEKYSVDINLDGKYDELDVAKAKEFADAFNIGILTSEYSFSCGNLLPSILKELGYKTIGERTGGGSCAIIVESTADGIGYVHSSYHCLSDSSGHNIDDGVAPDFAIEKLSTAIVDEQTGQQFITYDYSSFFDIATVGNYLSTAYNE